MYLLRLFDIYSMCLATGTPKRSGIQKKKNVLKVAPYIVFLTARELVSKSRDGASFKKSTRKSRAIKRNKMSTNMASKFVKKNFGTVARVFSSFKTVFE